MDGQTPRSLGSEGMEGASTASLNSTEASTETQTTPETSQIDISGMNRTRSNNGEDPNSVKSIIKEFRESTKGPTEKQHSEMARLVVLNLIRKGTLLLPAHRHDMIGPIRNHLDSIAKEKKKTVDQIATFEEVGEKKGDKNVAVRITLIDKDIANTVPEEPVNDQPELQPPAQEVARAA